MAKSCVIIPARYNSSRFPGKPLIKLLNKSMILWVAEISAIAVGKENVFVATDDNRIKEEVNNYGYKSLMTSPKHLTGTDRIAEAASLIDYDIYINVQGDEPLIDPKDIKKCIAIKKEKRDAIINGYCWMDETEDPNNINIPKVATTHDDRLIYMSRNAVPGFKDVSNKPTRYKKQVCIYGFNKEQLNKFSKYKNKTDVEESEDIEILRFLDLNEEIYMFECKPGSLAVDVPSDVPKVEYELKKLNNENSRL
jgi:3-deoxy-manno-octulosonate cytidylyltransferase (CMP-KDO synthetase)